VAISSTASDSITLDTTKPVITSAPSPSFQKAHLGTTSVPILIKWAGTDATSGINHYDLQESVDGGLIGAARDARRVWRRPWNARGDRQDVAQGAWGTRTVLGRGWSWEAAGWARAGSPGWKDWVP
jgi:hypothetical protein